MDWSLTLSALGMRLVLVNILKTSAMADLSGDTFVEIHFSLLEGQAATDVYPAIAAENDVCFIRPLGGFVFAERIDSRARMPKCLVSKDREVSILIYSEHTMASKVLFWSCLIYTFHVSIHHGLFRVHMA